MKKNVPHSLEKNASVKEISDGVYINLNRINDKEEFEKAIEESFKELDEEKLKKNVKKKFKINKF